MTQDARCNLELADSHDGVGKFMLAGVMNFDSVISLNQRAQVLFPQYKQIIVDLSGVNYVNSAGLALLLEWKRQSVLDGKTMKILGIPQKLANIARVSEIDKILSF